MPPPQPPRSSEPGETSRRDGEGGTGESTGFSEAGKGGFGSAAALQPHSGKRRDVLGSSREGGSRILIQQLSPGPD